MATNRRGSSSVVDELLPNGDTIESSSGNPRKRKKSSRACDFCHVNHQPCDNAKPRCSYCERHGKTCLYLRPQKKRGPAQGYRSALHTMRESAAAWGAALNLIPSLGPVIEGYLKNSAEGKRLVGAIKDPQQQEFFIQAWQQSPVFKAFFGDDGDAGDDGDSGDVPEVGGGGGGGAAGGVDGDGNGDGNGDMMDSLSMPSVAAAAAAAAARNKRVRTMPSAPTSAAPVITAAAERDPVPDLPLFPTPTLPAHETGLLKFDAKFDSFLDQHAPTPSPSQDDYARPSRHSSTAADMGPPSVSLSDIVARDAARSYNFSQTLGSLGFAPDETLNDFLALSYNPDPIANNMADLDPSLGSEMDQKAYYELLMGKRFT